MRSVVSQVVHILYLCPPYAADVVSVVINVHLMTAKRSAYSIRFSGLGAGRYEYRFHIGDDFFAEQPDSVIQQVDAEAVVVLHKAATIQLELRLDGKITVECVRCLDPLSIPVLVEKTMLVRQVENPNPEEDDDDRIHIAMDAHEIDAAPLLRDYLLLQVPYRPVHENPECDPEILKFLATEPTQEQKDTWSALRNIKLN